MTFLPGWMTKFWANDAIVGLCHMCPSDQRKIMSGKCQTGRRFDHRPARMSSMPASRCQVLYRVLSADSFGQAQQDATCSYHSCCWLVSQFCSRERAEENCDTRSINFRSRWATLRDLYRIFAASLLLYCFSPAKQLVNKEQRRRFTRGFSPEMIFFEPLYA